MITPKADTATKEIVKKPNPALQKVYTKKGKLNLHVETFKDAIKDLPIEPNETEYAHIWLNRTGANGQPLTQHLTLCLPQVLFRSCLLPAYLNPQRVSCPPISTFRLRCSLVRTYLIASCLPKTAPVCFRKPLSDLWLSFTQANTRQPQIQHLQLPPPPVQ